MDLEDILCEVVDWAFLPQDRDQYLAVVNTKKKYVLSTTVQILDVITSFNLNCYPVMMDQPRAAILFRRHGN
jgi:hypothetical protein